jgi:hypothetical protein
MIRHRQKIRMLTATALAIGVSAGCDRSPTALDAVQRDGLRQVIEAAGAAGANSVESDFRGLAWRLAAIVEPTPRLPVLEELFDRAIERAALQPDRFNGESIRSEHRQLADQAWAAVAAGEQDEADGALTVARTFMASHAIEVLGEPVAAAYVALVGLAIDHAAARLSAVERTPPRAFRMLASARNLHGDAGEALMSADYTRAVDIAGHAAGLLNAIEAAGR